MSTPTLTSDATDDLIYSARAGDLLALQEDLNTLSTQHTCSPADIVLAAVDKRPEEEGGSGCCLLHYPAANGNVEILNYLLETLKPSHQQSVQSLLNHRNNSGNTPLHWASLNTHLPCVQSLVNAGTDITLKNDAGLDAVFLAERTAWANGEVKEGDEDEAGEKEDEREAGPGGSVVEWLLSSERGGELESGVGGEREGDNSRTKENGDGK